MSMMYIQTCMCCVVLVCLIRIPSLTEMRGCASASIYKYECNHNQLRLKQQLETICSQKSVIRGRFLYNAPE